MPNSSFKPVIVAPTYNNAATLPDILARIVKLGIPAIVVNDGSTDATAEILAGLSEANVVCLAHTVNRGKAAAMRTAFAHAAGQGFTHAATIDTDGQLDPEEIPRLLERARESQTSLVIGVRDAMAADYPSRSRFGRKFSNQMVRLEAGLRVNDSQCGLRVYPLGLVMNVRCSEQRFGFETEIITRAGWAGCGVVETPVNCRYLPPGQRVSHFRPVMDSLRALAMHARLLGRALLPWPHPQWPPGEREKLTVKSVMKWMSPREAWRQLRHEESGHAMFATGLALGVFIANLPIYGAQTVFSLYASKRLHLHPAPVVLGTQVSMPPIGIAMIVLAIYVGHLILNGSMLAWPEGGWTMELVWRLGPSLLFAWVVGSLIVGTVMAILTYVLAVAFFRIVLPKRVPESDERR